MDIRKWLSHLAALVVVLFFVRQALNFAPDFLTLPLIIGGLAFGVIGIQYGRYRQPSALTIKDRS